MMDFHENWYEHRMTREHPSFMFQLINIKMAAVRTWDMRTVLA